MYLLYLFSSLTRKLNNNVIPRKIVTNSIKTHLLKLDKKKHYFNDIPFDNSSEVCQLLVVTSNGISYFSSSYCCSIRSYKNVALYRRDHECYDRIMKVFILGNERDVAKKSPDWVLWFILYVIRSLCLSFLSIYTRFIKDILMENV